MVIGYLQKPNYRKLETLLFSQSRWRRVDPNRILTEHYGGLEPPLFMDTEFAQSLDTVSYLECFTFQNTVAPTFLG